MEESFARTVVKIKRCCIRTFFHYLLLDTIQQEVDFSSQNKKKSDLRTKICIHFIYHLAVMPECGHQRSSFPITNFKGKQSKVSSLIDKRQNLFVQLTQFNKRSKKFYFRIVKQGRHTKHNHKHTAWTDLHKLRHNRLIMKPKRRQEGPMCGRDV